MREARNFSDGLLAIVGNAILDELEIVDYHDVRLLHAGRSAPFGFNGAQTRQVVDDSDWQR
jgi:hypothetical protein